MWYWADNSSPAKMRPDGWLGSNMFRGREIHDLRSLNRVLGDGGLVLAKRKPFDLLAERLFLLVGATEHQLNFFWPRLPSGIAMASGWFKRRDLVCRFRFSTPKG